MIKSTIVSDPGDEVTPIVETDTKKLIRVAIVGAGGSGKRPTLPWFGSMDIPKDHPSLRAISLVEKTERAYRLRSELLPLGVEQALEMRRIFDDLMRDNPDEGESDATPSNQALNLLMNLANFCGAEFENESLAVEFIQEYGRQFAKAAFEDAKKLAPPKHRGELFSSQFETFEDWYFQSEFK